MIDPGGLWPQLEALHGGAELLQSLPALFTRLVRWQYVRVDERQQMDASGSTQFAQEVVTTLQHAAVRRVRHDLRQEQDLQSAFAHDGLFFAWAPSGAGWANGRRAGAFRAR